MKNSTETDNEVVRNTRTLGRYADYASKAKRHRYERRKVRGLIGAGQWDDDDLV